MSFKIPHELKQSIKNGRLIIFTGAGISINEGLPSWKEIVLTVLEEKSEYIPQADAYKVALESEIMSPLDVLDKIEGNKKHIYDIFEKELTTDGKKSDFIMSLTEVTSKFITTNFDHLIENSIPDLRKITKDSNYNLKKIDTENSFVIKIHGDVGEIDNCIIFSKQYKSLYNEKSLAAFQLKKIFSEYTVLFIGFSFSDPYIAELFDYIAKMQDGLGPKHYIITSESLNHAFLTDIPIEHSSDLEAYIKDLLKKVSNVEAPSKSKVLSEKKATPQVDGSDIPPSISRWVGREKEITALDKDYKVYFITGLGGQGKSALAAFYLDSKKESHYQLFDWRDFKEEGHKFQSKIISMIMLVKDERNCEHEYVGLSDELLVNLFFNALGNIPALFIMDNIDRYIDLESLKPLDGISILYHKAVSRNHKSKFIFTCRPSVNLADLEFFQIPLCGLSAEDIVQYFENSSLSIKSDKITPFAIRAYELTEGHPLWISLIVAQAKRGEKELELFLRSISKNDITDDNPSSIMSKNILGKIWSSLRDRHKIVLRSLAESVQSLTSDEYSEIVSTELTYNKFNRSLRDVKNLGLIVEKKGGEYLELHPLVKEFIKNKFPRSERTRYIHLFIKYYGKVVLILKPKLSNRFGLNDFVNWTNQIELYSNAKEYQEALDVMYEIHDPMKSAGYIEEFLRVASIVFQGLTWDKHKIANFNNFSQIYLDTVKSSVEFGDIDLSDYLLNSYESIIENKDPSYITLSEAKAYYHWFNEEYSDAIDICEKSAFLLEAAKQAENTALRNDYALALRDSKVMSNMEKSLRIFLSSEDINIICDSFTVDKTLGGAFYGNVGRCLQFMGETQNSINCLSKSFIVLYDGTSSDRVLNLGYASIWLSELLNQEGRVVDAFYFQRYSLINFEKASPPLHNNYKANNQFDSLNNEISIINNLGNWKVEKYCTEMVRSIIHLKDKDLIAEE